MSENYWHPSGGRPGTAALPRTRQDTAPPAATTFGELSDIRRAGRSCCCSAMPMVVAFIPASPGRPHRTDLLLCGHHYRASKAALAAAGATILDMKGMRLADGEWPGDSC